MFTADIASTTKRFWSHVEKTDSCWLWTASVDGRGYGQLTILGHRYTASRRVWQLCVGEIPPGLFVLHKCDIRRCVNPDHLFPGTQKDNMQDCISKGRNRYITHSGEENGHSKLKTQDVVFIRQMSKKGKLGKFMAPWFGVSQATISKVIRGETWRRSIL